MLSNLVKLEDLSFLQASQEQPALLLDSSTVKCICLGQTDVVVDLTGGMNSADIFKITQRVHTIKSQETPQVCSAGRKRQEGPEGLI